MTQRAPTCCSHSTPDPRGSAAVVSFNFRVDSRGGVHTWPMEFRLGAPWEALAPNSDDAMLLGRELALELAPDHPLYGQEVRVVGRSHQADDLLVAVPSGWAIVHLTWSRRPELPGIPDTDLYSHPDEVQRVIDIQVAEHAEDWETYDRLVGLLLD